MEALRALGIRLAIDDFGTGHSSLARLGEFPVTHAQDRPLVRSRPARARHRAHARHRDPVPREGFGLEVIAEGVETEAQRHFLLDAGCRYAQGYLFSPPVEPTRSATSGCPAPSQ